ncbi:hypothetical protein [Streptomyces sp. ODS28]|uniref:hypothetical protein n=1 Tax=Streptomyces sp. ODS28 TaxID=3136688 RepID=UPI0031E5A83D
MTFAIPRPRNPGARGEHGGPPDELELPADAGLALLRRGVRTGPVAYDRARRRCRLLVPEGTADELPGLLAWLEWEGVELELTARSPYIPRETAVWLRPPGRVFGADRVDLVRLVSAAATECHRAMLSRTARTLPANQPLAFS